MLSSPGRRNPEPTVLVTSTTTALTSFERRRRLGRSNIFLYQTLRLLSKLALSTSHLSTQTFKTQTFLLFLLPDALEKLDKVTLYELRQLSPCTVEGGARAGYKDS